MKTYFAMMSENNNNIKKKEQNNISLCDSSIRTTFTFCTTTKVKVVVVRNPMTVCHISWRERRRGREKEPATSACIL